MTPLSRCTAFSACSYLAVKCLRIISITMLAYLLLHPAGGRRNFGLVDLGLSLSRNIYCLPLWIPPLKNCRSWVRKVLWLFCSGSSSAEPSLSVVTLVRKVTEEPWRMTRMFWDPQFLWCDTLFGANKVLTVCGRQWRLPDGGESVLSFAHWNFILVYTLYFSFNFNLFTTILMM